ncbi:MAG: MerR family transcriptional regulator, partial [Halothiobacillaceae bacterium]
MGSALKNIVQYLYTIPSNSASVIHNEATDKLGLYPIRTVSQITGVNPITLRAWERRYGLVKPLRTEKGHRLYSQRDIEVIKRVTELLEQGMAISQAAPMLMRVSAGEAAPLNPIAPANAVEPCGSWGDAYDAALASLDEVRLDALESEALAFTHPDTLLERQLLPRLDDMEGIRQHDADADARYFLLQSRLTRQLAQRASACTLPANAPSVLVASLPPERGLFSLWRWVWSLRRAGIHARLLGGGVPAQTLLQALRMAPVQALLLAFDHKPPLAVMGTQLPLLVEARQPVLAFGPHALAL